MLHPQHQVTPLEQLLRDTNPDNLDWDTQRLWRAIMLAPTLEVCVALLKRQPVPKSALDFVWVRRFGI